MVQESSSQAPLNYNDRDRWARAYAIIPVKIPSGGADAYPKRDAGLEPQIAHKCQSRCFFFDPGGWDFGTEYTKGAFLDDRPWGEEGGERSLKCATGLVP